MSGSPDAVLEDAPDVDTWARLRMHMCVHEGGAGWRRRLCCSVRLWSTH